MGLSLTLAPGYNEHSYPFVLVKEDTYLSILNPFENLFASLISFMPDQQESLLDPINFTQHYHMASALSDDHHVMAHIDSKSKNRDLLIYTVIPNEYGSEETGGRWDLVKIRIDGRKLRQAFA